MVLVLVAVSLAATSLGSPTFWICLILGIIMLGVFAIIVGRSLRMRPSPLSCSNPPVFVAAVLAGILWNFGESGMLLQASNFWQHVVGVSPSVVGVAIAPLLIAGIVAASLSEPC